MNKKNIIVLSALCALVSAPAYALSTKESIAAMDQRLGRIEQLLQSQGLLDMLQQLESLQQEVSQLRGEIEVQNYTLEQLNKRQRALYTDIDQRIQSLESNRSPSVINDAGGAERPAETAAPDSPPLQTLAPAIANRPPGTDRQTESPLVVELVDNAPAAATAPAAALSATTGAVVVAPDALVNAEPAAVAETQARIESNPTQARADYQRAFRLLKQSRYDQAIKAFNEFLAAHPDSDYADNAQYWLGEAFYVTRQFEQALGEYNKLVAGYPDSQKLTHALLKIGYSRHELGQTEAAVALLEELQQKYPDTTAARLAASRLQKIRAAQPGGAVN